jgi:hypothetical protein
MDMGGINPLLPLPFGAISVHKINRRSGAANAVQPWYQWIHTGRGKGVVLDPCIGIGTVAGLSLDNQTVSR